MTLEKSQIDPENATYSSKSNLFGGTKENNKLRTFKATSNTLAHILIGFTVGINMFFAFSFGLPLSPTPMHIVLCVNGYQLLMAEGILVLFPDNSWSTSLTLVQKRRVHWILQLVGSALAIAGSVHIIIAKTEFDMGHWNSLHGIFGLVALIFTIVSLVNGLTSLYAYELRRFLPAKLSKISHILLGAIALIASSVSLCYGYDMESFKDWSSSELSIALIIITNIFTFIVIVNPILIMIGKYFTR